jgi:hypothetical protein
LRAFLGTAVVKGLNCFSTALKLLLNGPRTAAQVSLTFCFMPLNLSCSKLLLRLTAHTLVTYNAGSSSTFGLLKGRFRKLSMLLNQKNTTSMAELIIACMLVHNLLIDVHDPVPVEEEPILNNDAEESQRNGTLSFLANQKRDQIRDSLSNQ